jgi:MinD superfamily P-loop ATPase
LKIAVASGKGGTGKTTIATGLYEIILNKNQKVAFIDCDVEAPNAHIFLKPEIRNRESVGRLIPVVDESKCDGNRKCADLCQYSAIVRIADKTLVFEDLCHSCGGCKIVCPENAITEQSREIGYIETGICSNTGEFMHGYLNIGQALAVPLIRQLKNYIRDDIDNVILDAPPGTSCPVVETANNTDYIILVTEPTPFGLNDLRLAVGMAKELGIPYGVVINRCDIGNEKVSEYCRKENIDILSEIPNRREVAEAYSRGDSLVSIFPDIKKMFEEIYNSIRNGRR